ncbi:kinesin-domain-containing protein [Panus rudis PR-1116 ss-1]|nr:kinesin-domain-containing protein [Panus rudis PR-1116 ss-1]
MASARRINIVTRVRPPILNETDDKGVRIQRGEDGKHWVLVNNPRDLAQVFKYSFSACYGPDSTQEEIFDNEVQPMIDAVFEGMTVTIFAYGVTSSGKTHTMQGTNAHPGIIPRAVEALFLKKQASSQIMIDIALSYMEIYKDEVYDLLIERENAPKLPVRENGAGQVFVANLTTQDIDTVEDFDMIYSNAMKRRSVASTNLNRASSRSHAILTLLVTVQDLEQGRTLCGKLNLVDLAGSENNKLTGNDSSRMAESSAINKSLSVLGQVVHALNKGATRIPYRNSKLTRILQDALGGSSIGLLICNIAPAPKYRQDTLNTLNFAVHTKNVENKPVVNEKDMRPSAKPAPSYPPAARTSGVSLTSNTRMPRPSNASSDATRLASRVPRPSSVGLPAASSSRLPREQVPVKPVLSEEDIDAKIARAVEAEVARRMAEHEKQLSELQEKSRESEPSENSSRRSPGVDVSSSRHDLRHRLQELEQKLDTSNSDMRIINEMSPVSRKKHGRAYVALARAQTEKNNLQLALELYRKAEAYVPDNIKLKERWILFVVHVFLHMISAKKR